MASIPLQIQTPQIQGPLTTLGQVLQTRDLAGRIQQQQAQTADIQAQADQRNKDIADQNTLQEAMRDPAAHARIMQGDFSDVTGKIQPKTLFGVQKAQQDYLAQKLTNTKAQNEDRLEAYGEINNALKGLSTYRKPDGTLDLERVNQGLQATILNLQNAGVFKRAGLDPSQYSGRTFTDPKQFDAVVAGTNGEMAVTQQALDTQKSQAETQEALGKGREASAQGQLNQQKADLQKQAIAAFQSDPEGTASSAIDRVLPPQLDKTANASYKAAYKDAMLRGGPDAAGAVETAATAHAAAIAEQTNPLVMGSKAKQSGLDANARIPAQVSAERQMAPIREQATIDTQRALNGGDDPRFATVSPHELPQAVQGTAKAQQDYLGSVTAAKEMSDFINLARSGNVEAYAYAPTTGVLTINTANGTKRINMAEVQGYGGAGSDLDKVQGWLGKHLTGNSIDGKVLDAMEQVHGTLLSGAQDTYRNKQNAINTLYRAKVDPEQLIGSAKTPTMSSLAGVTLPASLSASDVGKVYDSPTKGRIKITAVNPNNPTQFTWQPAQ